MSYFSILKFSRYHILLSRILLICATNIVFCIRYWSYCHHKSHVIWFFFVNIFLQIKYLGELSLAHLCLHAGENWTTGMKWWRTKGSRRHNGIAWFKKTNGTWKKDWFVIDMIDVLKTIWIIKIGLLYYIITKSF